MPDDGPFADPKWLDLCDGLLERLRGRISLVQTRVEREQLVTAVLGEMYDRPWRDLLPQLSGDGVRQAFVQFMMSYEPIEALLADPAVEDIMVNSTEAIFVHRADEGLAKTDQRFPTQRELALFVKKLLVFSGRTEIDAINDVELPDGRGRVNIVSSPFGPQITITRAKEHPLSILQLITGGMLTCELAAQLWLYVEGLGVKPANMIISGGPGVGKTTLLNALLSFMPWTDRIVTIEDTLELDTRFLENCARLESDRRMTMAALVKNSLRMRPDRIIVGEVRGEEAQDLMTAVSVGKYCLGTLHASTARETILRMQHWPMRVPEMLINLVDVFITLHRFRLDGKVARVVGEVVETAGMEQKIVLLSPVWAYNYERRQTEETSPSSVYRDKVAKAIGWQPVQIMQEVARRAKVLRVLQTKPEMAPIGELTRFCQRYSVNAEEALAQFGMSAKALDVTVSYKVL